MRTALGPLQLVRSAQVLARRSPFGKTCLPMVPGDEASQEAARREESMKRKVLLLAVDVVTESERFLYAQIQGRADVTAIPRVALRVRSRSKLKRTGRK